MARKNYGTTWWGKQWLNAFNNISDSNRLPRGKTYANTGRARNIKIDKNKITADVKGSRPTPYKITIDIPLFTKSEQKQVLELINDNPLFLSQLLNRELPPTLDDACAKIGISIFPSSWRDFNASCSCPDWAMPCKHLASVIYLIANEIDKNPFLVFEMHGLDLGKAFEKANMGVSKQQQIPIKKAVEFYQSKKKKESDWVFDENYLEKLDFTQIPNLKESILTIVSSNPVFLPEKDFKFLLEKAYTGISKNIKRASKITKTKEVNFVYENIDDFIILLDKNGHFSKAIAYQNDKPLLTFDDLEALSDWITDIPFGRLEYCIPSLQALFFIERFTIKLLENSAFIPQLISLEEPNTFRVRWLPALLNEDIKRLFEIIEGITPPDLLQYAIKKTKRTYNYNCIYEEKTLGIASLFLTLNVPIHSTLDVFYPVEALFFKGHTRLFNSFEDQAIPQSIQLWLNRFYLAEKTYQPVIQIKEEKNGGFRVKLLVNDKKDELSEAVSLKKIFTKKSFKKNRLDILRDWAILIPYFPEIEPVINSKGSEKLQFDTREFAPILLKILPIIRLFGIKTLLPKALQKLLRPKLSMELSADKKGVFTQSNVISLAEILKFDWKVAIGNIQVTQDEFLKMVKKMSGIVKLKDQYVFFEEAEVRKLLDKLENPPKIDNRELLHIALSEDYNGGQVFLDKHAQKLIKKWLKEDKVKVPKKLLATLRPYQQRGYAWMYKNARLGFGSVIADDMGLGKTIQVIATILKLKEDKQLTAKKGLIVVPTTLLTNWDKEIAKFAPSIKTHIYHGPKRQLEVDDTDLIITTYGTARSDVAKINKRKWSMLVIDEAQNIKNPSTAQSKAIRKINADVKIAMSGTPVENRMSEYWSIFDFANKGFLGSLNNFGREYAKPIELEADRYALNKFRRITAPFIMRRVKTDKSIITDLPDKIESNQYCSLTPEQSSLYESIVQENLKMVESSEGIDRGGLILKLITALKQVCNHPAQFLKKGNRTPDVSGKSLVLFDLMKRILNNGEKTLIFTQYREMGELLAEMFAKEMNLTVPFLHGGVTRKKRDAMVDDFQTNHSSRIILLSLKAAGTGLNLTAASNVVHYDLWWNPAVEAQATDRAYRIGQKNNVQVHRFITKGTFEEKIDTLIQKKKELADLTVSSGENWIGKMSNRELKALIKLE